MDIKIWHVKDTPIQWVVYISHNLEQCITWYSHGGTAEVWEWISNSIPDFIINVIIYPCWNESYHILAKGDPCHIRIDNSMSRKEHVLAMMMSWNGNSFHHWPLVREIHQSLAASPHKWPIMQRERERLSLSAFLRTEDIGVHIVHISCLIITYTLE